MLRPFSFIAACSLAVPAGASWHVATSRHFVVYMNDTPERVRAYATQTERFDKAIRTLRNSPDPDRGDSSRVTIFVVGSVADVQRLTGNPHAAGVYDARATGSVSLMPRDTGNMSSYGMTARAILQHEYTHHWMLTTWTDAALPVWLVEGFAEFHATAQLRPDGSMVFGAPPLYRLYGINTANQMPVERLLTMNYTAKTSGFVGNAFYARSWLLTHYMMFDPARRKQLAAYIAALNNGKTPKDAAPILGDPGRLDLKLNAWMQRSSFPSLSLPKDQLSVGDIKVRELSSAESAAMGTIIQTSFGVGPKTAPGVAARARSLASAYPETVAIQNELAEAEYDAASLGPKAAAADGYARADAAADRVLSLDARDVHALVYKGMISEQRATDAKSTDAAVWKGVRRWYLNANRVDPENPVPLIRFYDSFGAAKQKPTPNAESGMLYAYALAPYDAHVRYQAGRVLLGQGKVKDARIALVPLAYSPETGPIGERMRKVLSELDKGGAPAALAEFARQDAAVAADDKKEKSGDSPAS